MTHYGIFQGRSMIRLARAGAAAMVFALGLSACSQDGQYDPTSPTEAPSIDAAVSRSTSLEVTPKAILLSAGDRAQLSAVVRSGSGTQSVTPEWRVSGGGSVDEYSVFNAGQVSGTFTLTAIWTNLSKSISVTIVGGTAAALPKPPTSTPVTSLALTPEAVTLAPAGKQQFAVASQSSDGAKSAPTVTYSATGGTITSAGLYTAGKAAGSFRVIAVQQGGTRADTSAITIAAAGSTKPSLTSLSLTPGSVTLAPAGKQQFSVAGLWSDGSKTAPAVTYSATGGTITSAGLYTAGNATGSFRVIAVQQGGARADTSVVTVAAANSNPVLKLLAISPAVVSLVAGKTQQFSVLGTLTSGITSVPLVSYSATGGTITSGGLFTAGNSAGTFRVIATVAGGVLADTSSVTVTVSVPTNPPTTNPGSTNPGGSSSGDPQPSGNIVFDTRAGGAHSYQNMTNISQLKSVWNHEVRYSSGATGFFEPNVDGRGTKAHGIQWAGNGAEQEAVLARDVSAPSNGWYTSWKMFLGKSATGGGSGGVGAFSLTGSNAHQKIMLWYRDNDGGNAHRIYLVMRPTDCKFEIDGQNWSSGYLSVNPYNLRGQVIQMTVFIQPSTGTIKVWVNGTLALNQSGQQAGIGNMGLSSIQQTVTTRLVNQAEVQYTWDTVVWY